MQLEGEETIERHKRGGVTLLSPALGFIHPKICDRDSLSFSSHFKDFLFNVFFFSFFCTHGMKMFLSQGLNQCHSSNLSYTRDNAKSLTHWITGNSSFVFLFPLPVTSFPIWKTSTHPLNTRANIIQYFKPWQNKEHPF